MDRYRADDFFPERRDCTAILRLLGHQVECAYSGPAAVDLARHFKPAIVLMDLAMPGMNGFETLRLMRSQPGTEHVFADAHLTKPADLNALVALLNQATTHSSQ